MLKAIHASEDIGAARQKAVQVIEKLRTLLTTDLSRIRNSFVIARNTAFTFKGKNIPVKEISKELGVRYSAGGDGAEGCFFERAPDRAVAGAIDDAEFHDLVLQQPQGPACASLGWLGTGQGNQLGLLLAVENPSDGRHRARLAAQHSLEAFFHQLLARPVNHGRTGLQSFDDPVVTPPFAGFRDIGLQQDPRLQYPSRRALSLPDQRFKPFAFLAAQPYNILSLPKSPSVTEISFAAMIAPFASRWRRERITKSFQIG